MNAVFTHTCRTRTWITFALALVALIGIPALVSADDAVVADQPLEAAAQQAVLVDADGLPTVAFASSKPNNLECERCNCINLSTPPTTRVGATCLKARQKAAAAARDLAVCSPPSTSCGPVTHSVAPCEPLSGGGYSATATAYYSCEYCFNICQFDGSKDS